jgi:anti-sigma factor (TIGR02949 family)
VNVTGSGNENEMSCQELVELVTDYFEGALSEDDRRRFEEHLAECPHCVTHLEQIRITTRALGRVTELSLPPPARSDLLRAFREWRAERA